MIDPRRTIIVNGRHVAEGWDKVIAEAQDQRTYSIGGVLFDRIPFGEDFNGEPTDNAGCRDCAAAPGQLHVVHCCLEQCPRCETQAIGCGCPHDDQDDNGEVQE